MTDSKENHLGKTIVLGLTLVLTAVFVLTSWIWVYWFNILLGLPCGLMAAASWFMNRHREPHQKAYKMIGYFLIGGVAIMGISLIAFNFFRN